MKRRRIIGPSFPYLATPITAGGGGGGPTFPTLSNIVGRWNANNVITSSGNVTQATDLSGQGNHLTNTGTVPLNTTGYNGGPAIRFINANSAYLKRTPFNLSQFNSTDCTVYAIGRFPGSLVSSAGVLCYSDTTNNDYSNPGSFAFTTDINDLTMLIGADNQTKVISSNFAGANARFGFRVSMNNGSNFDVILNGTITTGSFIQTSTTWVTSGQLAMGTRILSGVIGGNYFEGVIVEMVVCNAILSSGDITALDTYYTTVWGA